MLERWGRLVHRRRRPVLALGVLALVAAAVWGTGVFGALTAAGGFTTPDSESARAARIAERDLGRDQADVVVLYTAPRGRTIDDPGFRSAVTGALAALPADKVTGVVTHWSTGSPDLVSRDRTATYAVLRLAGADPEERADNFADIEDALRHPGGAAGTARLGGEVATETAINDRVSRDIARAEMLSLPVLLILLTVIFGGVAAASLPLVVGGMAILGSFAALRLLTLGTDVSIFAVNITTFLGLGLAIDYGLFVVGRFREELAAGRGTEEALARTMATAGRTVAVSGITVAVSLAGLTLFPQTFLRSMGYGGVATVVVCMAAALTVLPALLAVLGPRVNALSFRRRRATAAPAARGGWYRLAQSVMRRPVLYLVGAMAVLLSLGTPFLGISWGGVDGKVLPEGTEARVVAETLQRDFPSGATAPIEVIVSGRVDARAYAQRLGQVPGVTQAAVTGAAGTTAKISLRYAADPMSAEARALVERVRDVPAPPGARVYVGGRTAELVDQLSGLGARLPLLAATVGGATFVLLFLAFGSVVLPVKAMAANALSLSATFGVVVWIFQEGHLSGVLDFTATGSLAPAMPILMLALLFGLTMDYEVFLLSRIRERYDATGDTAGSVASGLQRSAGVITGAALLFIVVMAAFSTSGISFIKMTGVGMVTAVLLDATIVRGLLVPAAMRLLGRANWWAPGPLARVYRRYGIREDDAPAPAAGRLEPAGT
ncbi:membrane protein [Actinomadura rubrobrunea]|uniref:Membrane protein n=1 Tax=Actinomadura rubrobrunea TaxID=115335 RepID=A0A9W6PSM0_9ACTN|nr:MMPL family transporter [Actinomadura rubrobrunea]GLW62308.1 membrane protein [Actinomadura rubrobrunea]